MKRGSSHVTVNFSQKYKLIIQDREGLEKVSLRYNAKQFSIFTTYCKLVMLRKGPRFNSKAPDKHKRASLSIKKIISRLLMLDLNEEAFYIGRKTNSESKS